MCAVLQFIFWRSTFGYFLKIQSTSAISSIRRLELLLAWTVSLDPSALSVTALINSFRIFNPAILNFHYVELLSQSLFISLIGMLKKYIRKLWLNVYLFLFQHNNMSVKRKLNVKIICEKFSALKNIEIGLFNKKVAKKSLLLPLHYFALQWTKYSISFTPFLNLWKTKILDFFDIFNIHYLGLFFWFYGGSRWRMLTVWLLLISFCCYHFIIFSIIIVIIMKNSQ